MPKKKKKTLPKDFAALLESVDLPTLEAIFDECDVDARGGYGKQTAMAFDLCPDALVRWLVVDRGLDVNAADSRGDTPLHARVGSRRSSIAVLLELGADVHAVSGSSGTPLHRAASAKNASSVSQLLERGAVVDARTTEGLTPLELGLRTCSNIEIEGMVRVASLLLAAGAAPTPRMKKDVEAIGQRFEFHRAGFARESVEAVSSALVELYALLGVKPVAARKLHDGHSRIEVSAKTWPEQHAELWEMLVPSSGPAATQQGELIRVSGRISHEVDGNGAANWDADFREMARSFLEALGSGTPLPPSELARAREVIAALPHSDDTRPLPELAVRWVQLNPQPAVLGKPTYRR